MTISTILERLEAGDFTSFSITVDDYATFTVWIDEVEASSGDLEAALVEALAAADA